MKPQTKVVGGLWLLLVGVWAYLLLEPKPVPESVFDNFSWFDVEMLKFVLAKSLHLCFYAFLAWLGAAWSGPRRAWVWGFLVLHGVATEIGQMFVPNRHGCVRDMLIDASGVLLGASFWRKPDVWRLLFPRPAPAGRSPGEER